LNNPAVQTLSRERLGLVSHQISEVPMTLRAGAYLVLLVIGLASGMSADSAQPAKEAKKPKAAPTYEFRQQHDPDGIGKFYLGREIAQVMGHEGANWLERPEREKEEHCSKLLPALEIKAGDRVADIGAGSGFYTFRISEMVGAKGRVFAVDIQPEMIKIIRGRMRNWKLKNIQPVQGTIADPKLKANDIDLILMVDVYHEFSHPYEMTTAMVKALKPKGRLVFVEYRMEDENVPIKLVHKMTKKQVAKEMAAHALRHVETLNHLPWQHIIIYEKVEKKTDEKGESGSQKGSQP
jgi:ubiquinone/menaquinone biosynthesis C-methylase UbiE